MKTFKILFFLAISTFFLSCTAGIIEDTDGDGVSDTADLVDDVYEYRADYFMQDNIVKYGNIRRNPKWYKSRSPIDVSSPLTPRDEQYIEKDGVRYAPLYDYDTSGDTAAVYEITKDDATPANLNKFVFITLEPVPIFKENMVILLVSKYVFDTADDAKAAAEVAVITKIKMSISHLDLVFDTTIPEADYLSYENIDQNIATILANYNLLEFFGTSYSYDEKQELLSDYGYGTSFFK